MFREQKNAKNMFLKVLTEQAFCVILYPNRGFENVYAKTISAEGYHMKRIGLALGMFTLLWMVVSSLHLTNPYLRSSEFVEISVERGDSVWTIARRYAAKETMARELEEAIIEVNGLSPDATLYAGRRLHIPVIDPPEQLQAMAEYKALDTPAYAPYNGVTK
jgi:hypothetical protein